MCVLEQPEKLTGSLKEQLDAITPALHEMQLRKEERVKQFRDVLTQIQRVSSEIAGHQEDYNVLVNEGDLSQKKLEEYQSELQRLLIEKVELHSRKGGLASMMLISHQLSALKE